MNAHLFRPLLNSAEADKFDGDASARAEAHEADTVLQAGIEQVLAGHAPPGQEKAPESEPGKAAKTDAAEGKQTTAANASSEGIA